MKNFGIDVSSHQNQIDWTVLKDKIQFAIIRAGYGKSSSQRDDFFEYNYSQCVQNNIPCGVYWYSYALSDNDALKEADACYEVIKDKKFQYPVYLDIEDPSQSSLGRERICSIIKTFCNKLESLGYWVGIYSYKSFLENNLSDDIKNRYAVWIAHTGVEKTTYSGQFGIWQFSHNGKISGIDGSVDLNYCYLDYPSLIANAGKNNITAKNSVQYYTVKKDDTLWDISLKFYGSGLEYTKIKSFNNLSSDTIYTGQILKIPV